MADTFTFTIDGTEVQAKPGQTIMAAADAAGIYIPRLCNKDGLEPYGACFYGRFFIAFLGHANYTSSAFPQRREWESPSRGLPSVRTNCCWVSLQRTNTLDSQHPR